MVWFENKIEIFWRKFSTKKCSLFQITDECIGCSSTTDANCAQNPGILKSSPCNSNDRPNCYTRVVGECRPYPVAV